MARCGSPRSDTWPNELLQAPLSFHASGSSPAANQRRNPSHSTHDRQADQLNQRQIRPWAQWLVGFPGRLHQKRIYVEGNPRTPPVASADPPALRDRRFQLLSRLIWVDATESRCCKVTSTNLVVTGQRHNVMSLNFSKQSPKPAPSPANEFTGDQFLRPANACRTACASRTAPARS